MIGTQIAQYEILALIGSGGMGEVYRARDTRLGREVAVKILPESVSGDPERVRRFEQEARSAGALNHPNLVTVHDFGSHQGRLYLVMELLEGETLRQKMGAGAALSRATGESGSTPGSGVSGRALPTRKVLDIAAQVARGLAAAHDKGIIHRDLKPENIVVTPRGEAKILDFGLAKLTEELAGGGAHSVTRMAETEPGKIMGTVGYMSPEQVRGDKVDHRTDIFSLGVIVYELLSGRRAFDADSSVETMSAILREDPPALSGERSRISPTLDRIVRRCLEKEPGERFDSARDLAFALGAVRESSSVEERAVTSGSSGGSRMRWLAAGAGAVVLLAAGLFLGRATGGKTAAPAPASPGYRLVPLTFDLSYDTAPSISPDGRFMVYVRGENDARDIYFRQVGSESSVNLTADSPVADWAPAVSPDGSQVAFRSERDGGGIFLIGSTGGTQRRLTDRGFDPAWSPDGKEIVFADEGITDPRGRTTQSSLSVVEVATGKTRTLLDTQDAVEPAWSPDGRWIAFWGLPGGSGQRILYTMPVGGGTPTPLNDDSYFNYGVDWAPDSRSLFFISDRGGESNIWRMPIEPSSGKAAGDPVQVTLAPGRCEALSVARDGRIMFSVFTESAYAGIRPFDPVARKFAGPIDTLFAQSRLVDDARISPDGKWMVYRYAFPQEDLFVRSVDGRTVQQLTNDRFKDRWPAWTPDSQRVWFNSDRGGPYEVWSIRRDGSDLRKEITGGDARRLRALLSALDTAGNRALFTDWDSLQSGYVDLTKPVAQRTLAWYPKPPAPGLAGMTYSRDGTKVLGWGGIAPHLTMAVLDIPTGRFTDLGEIDGFMGFLPDNRTALYSRGGRVRWIDVETKASGDVGPDPDPPGGLAPRISPDGTSILDRWGTRRSQIWMLDPAASPAPAPAP